MTILFEMPKGTERVLIILFEKNSHYTQPTIVPFGRMRLAQAKEYKVSHPHGESIDNTGLDGPKNRIESPHDPNIDEKHGK